MLQRSGDGELGDMSACVNELFHYTVNVSRLRTTSIYGRSTTVGRPDDGVDAAEHSDELVYVADIADTNLLMVVVDGRPSVATTLDTSQR